MSKMREFDNVERIRKEVLPKCFFQVSLKKVLGAF